MAVIFDCTAYFLKALVLFTVVNIQQVYVLVAEHGDHCFLWKFNNYTSSFTAEYPEISLSWSLACKYFNKESNLKLCLFCEQWIVEKNKQKYFVF